MSIFFFRPVGSVVVVVFWRWSAADGITPGSRESGSPSETWDPSNGCCWCGWYGWYHAALPSRPCRRLDEGLNVLHALIKLLLCLLTIWYLLISFYWLLNMLFLLSIWLYCSIGLCLFEINCLIHYMLIFFLTHSSTGIFFLVRCLYYTFLVHQPSTLCIAICTWRFLVRYIMLNVYSPTYLYTSTCISYMSISNQFIRKVLQKSRETSPKNPFRVPAVPPVKFFKVGALDIASRCHGTGTLGDDDSAEPPPNCD